MRRLDGDARADFHRQHLLLVGSVLSIEHAGAGHGNHAYLTTLRGQLVGSFHRQTHFRTGGDQDQLRLARTVLQDVATAGDGRLGLVVTHMERQVLAREDQRARAILALDGMLPGHCGFDGIGRAPGIQVRCGAQAGQLLDRLVGRAVFAKADGIVGEDVDHPLLHQRRHAHRVARVFHEHQEGGAVGDQAAVQGDAVHDRGHAELAHAVVHVVARGVLGDHRLAALPQGQVGAGQVRRAAEQFRQQRAEGVQAVLAGLAAGDGLALGGHVADEFAGLLGEVGGQLTGHTALELGGQRREFGFIGGKALVPLVLGVGALLLGIPFGIDLGRDFEGAMAPAQRFAGQGDFGIAQGRAVGRFLALLVRRAETDDGLAADQRRPVALARGLDGHLDLVGVVAVDITDHLPAVSLEAARGVVGEPAVDFAIDGNAVVIVEGGELVQPQGAGQRADLVGYAFHQAAIAEEHIGVVVDDLMTRLIELRRHDFLRQGEAHGVGQALTQRTGGGLDAGGVAELRMARGLAVQLAEVLQVVDGQVVAGQVQQRVDQHRAVAVGQHEAVAIGPQRVGRAVFQMVAPEHFGDVRHAHGGTGMAAVGFLHGIHAEGADGIGSLTTAGHR